MADFEAQPVDMTKNPHEIQCITIETLGKVLAVLCAIGMILPLFENFENVEMVLIIRMFSFDSCFSMSMFTKLFLYFISYLPTLFLIYTISTNGRRSILWPFIHLETFFTVVWLVSPLVFLLYALCFDQNFSLSYLMDPKCHLILDSPIYRPLKEFFQQKILDNPFVFICWGIISWFAAVIHAVFRDIAERLDKFYKWNNEHGQPPMFVRTSVIV